MRALRLLVTASIFATFFIGKAVLSALTTRAVHLQGMSRGTSVLLLQY
jgi:hypothetical protein